MSAKREAKSGVKSLESRVIKGKPASINNTGANNFTHTEVEINGQSFDLCTREVNGHVEVIALTRNQF
jgi:hypothetical protein